MRRLVISSLAVLSLVGVACAPSAPPAAPAAPTSPPATAPAAKPAAAADKVRLQIKWVPQAQFAGYYVALDRGYYQTENLDVQIIPGGPDIVSEQQVANGQVDFGVDRIPDVKRPVEHLCRVDDERRWRSLRIDNSR